MEFVSCSALVVAWWHDERSVETRRFLINKGFLEFKTVENLHVTLLFCPK